ARDDGRDLIELLVQDVFEPEQMTRAHYRGDGAPGGERRPGGGDRLIYVTRRRQRYPTQRLGGGGIGEFEVVARGGLDPLAADMIPQSAHGARPAKPARATCCPPPASGPPGRPPRPRSLGTMGNCRACWPGRRRGSGR